MKTKSTMTILIAMALVISVFAAVPVLSFRDAETDSPLMETSDDVAMIELESPVTPQVEGNEMSIEVMNDMQPVSQRSPVINQENWHWMYDAEWRADWVSAVGVGDVHTWYGAMRIELPAGEIQQVAFFHLDGADYMKGLIYTDNGTTPGDLIAETDEVTDPPVEQWIEEPIVDPVTIDAGHYWVVIEVADDGSYYPFGVIDPYLEDAGWLSFDGVAWQTLQDQGLDYSWMLEVYVELAPGDPPEITLTSPIGGEEWVAHTEEDITWTTEETDDPISHVNLEYSADAGSSWTLIETDLPDTGTYTWTIPNENSVQCLVRATVVDTSGRQGENVSNEFEISGFPPVPPENLIVEHHSRTVLFEDDVEGGDLGYITSTSHAEASEWDIRQHGASSGNNSWDWGDGEFNKVTDYGMLSSLITPEIEIPAEADENYGVYLTFQHWRDFGDYEGYLFDGGNVKVSFEGLEGPWYLIGPEEGYDGDIFEDYGNPLGGQPGWGGASDWTTATFDLTVLIGETVHIRWDAGVEHYEGGEGAGWRIDDIYMDVLLPDEEGTEDNLLTWDASPDEDIDEVSQYNIYRSGESNGTYEHIDSIGAKGSAQYRFIDVNRGTADDIYWWYIVRAVGANGLEEQNEAAKQEPGDPGVTPPSITLTEPVGGEEWEADTQENITWTTDEGDYTIDYVNIWFSPNAGETWNTVVTYLDDTGVYTWTVPNIHTSEAVIRTRVVDTAGRWDEDESNPFDILGTPVATPENLTVDYAEFLNADWHWMYPTGHREVTPENAVGLDGEGLWYGAIRTELPEGLITDIAYFDYADAGNVTAMVYTDAGTPVNPEPGDLVAETVEVTDLGNMEWLEMAIVDPTYIDADHYWIILEIYDLGDGYFPFGAIEPYVADAGWLSFDMVDWDETIDFGLDLSWTLEAYVQEFDDLGDSDNLVTWEQSPDEAAGTVSHYNIYRTEYQSGPWDESTLIDSVPATGANQYYYFDINMGAPDGTWWWYVVRAVGFNWYEDQNEDAVQEPDAPIETYDIPLYAGGDGDGWNFVSFNLAPQDSSLEAILTDIDGSYDKVMYHSRRIGDERLSKWLSYVPGRDEHYNNLDTWNHTMGLWIHATADDTLTIEGIPPVSTDITLHPGWTMVGLPSETAGNHGLPVEIDVIGYFNASVEYNLAYDYEPDLFVFQPGEGYWIHNPTETAVVWTVDY